MDPPQLGRRRLGVVGGVLIVTQDEPAHGAAGPVLGLVAALAEIAAVPPRMAWLDGEADVGSTPLSVVRTRSPYRVTSRCVVRTAVPRVRRRAASSSAMATERWRPPVQPIAIVR